MEISKGKLLSAATVRQIISATEGAAQVRSVSGRAVSGKLGQTISIPLPMRGNDNIIYCVCRHTLPLFGLVEIEDAVNMSFSFIAQCQRVFRSGSSRLGVLLAPTVPGRIVPVQVKGVCLVKYYWIVGDDLEMGGRLGGLTTQPYAHKFDGGPLLVLAVAAHDPGWVGYNYALIEVTRKRLDNIRCVDCYTIHRVNGCYEVIIVGVGSSVTEIEPGVVEITSP